MSESGRGTFGKVLLCEDTRLRKRVAVKVVRRIRRYAEQAQIEAGILSDVNLADCHAEQPIVRLLSRFEWRGHFCMVMEPLGASLFDFVKANEYRPLPLFCVQSFADQLVQAVAFLHELQLVHTDLKLENILLVRDEGFVAVDKPTGLREKLPGPRLVLAPASGTAIKLIDFGGATFEYERKSSLINTRQYRAPEVILGLGWGTPSDMWSLGCILSKYSKR